MSNDIGKKSISNTVVYRFYIIMLLSFIVFVAILFLVGGFEYKESILISLMGVVCFSVLARVFLYSPIRDLNIKILSLEQKAADYNVGTKLLIRRDLELNRVNEKLKEFDLVKSNFISVVAHQLRTPLSGIKWTMNMLLNGDMGELNNDQKIFLMKSYESNNRMITLVNDMLDIDRIQSGRVHYGFRFISILDLMDNVIFEISPQASKKGVFIEFKNKFPDLPQVYVDPGTMRAVIQNLLENAIKYTMKKGKIEIDIKNEIGFLIVSVSDSGIGIPLEQQKKIFERFFRATNAIKHETDGSGLGLYIARTIIDKNGGKIWFESTEGKGSTFYFTVPTIDTSVKNKVSVPVSQVVSSEIVTADVKNN